ncbi:MAG: hypothetical protein QOJ48_1781 [Frankiales bacterium]|jgi:hypothetical protein|nr:hypothetical protein [Frankiales bacterium]
MAHPRTILTRRGLTLLASSSLVCGVLAASAPLANAAFVGNKLGSSNFEIDTDANLVVDGASPSIDWLTGGSGTSLRITPAADKASGTGDDSFGQGTSENDAVPTVTDGSIPPNKSDLKNFGVFQESGTSGNFLHLFWTRVQDPTGTTNMDFEFNKSKTISSNGVTPVRSAGDLLLTYDLGNGGTVATLSKRTWLASGSWSAVQALSGNAIGSINSSAITATNAGSLGSLSARTFGEASLNLDSILGTDCTTFGSAYLKSRSSDSFSAAIKDFIAPAPVNVSNCGGVSIHKQDDAGTALSGAVFTLYSNVAPLTAPRTAADTATALTCTTVASGNCSISNVAFGNYWVVETTTPANHDTAADQAISIAPGGNTPSGTLTFVDPRQQGSILVKKTDPAGGVLAGAAFTVTPGSLAMTESSTGIFCRDGLGFGSYTVTETTPPTGYNAAAAQTVSVSTKSTCAGRLAGTYTPDLTFVDSPAPGTINVLKTDDATPTANLLAGAAFTLFSDIGTVGTYEPATDTTVAAGPTTTGAQGTVQFASVPLGNYCVVETTTPANHTTAPAQCVTIGLGSSSSTGQTKNLTFVDPRTHKVIVIVCHEGTNTLDSSPVTLGGTTKSSLSSAGSLTEAQLCGLGGATFGGLEHGTTSASVDVQ